MILATCYTVVKEQMPLLQTLSQSLWLESMDPFLKVISKELENFNLDFPLRLAFKPGTFSVVVKEAINLINKTAGPAKIQ